MAEQHSSVLVAYSGGKDSRVVLDLCAKTFKRFEVFCMALVPGMQSTRAILDEARGRYGCVAHEVQHWEIYHDLSEGFWGSPVFHGVKGSPKSAYADIMRKAGIGLVATGCRLDEDYARRTMMARGRLPGWHPIAKWNIRDVVSYLKTQAIPIPDAGQVMNGWGLNTKALMRMHKEYPNDFELVAKVFPFVRGVIARQKLLAQ